MITGQKCIIGGAKMAEETMETVAEQPASARPVRRAGDDNVIFVGRKPSMAYVLGVITQFSDGKPEVFIKARGKAISRAVDVAEIVRRKFISDARIKSIDIGTEERELQDKSKINVSTISISLSK